MEQGLDVDTPDSYQCTPLWNLAYTRRVKDKSERMSLLVKLGADIERVNSQGETPLEGAISNLRADSVKILLKLGAKTSKIDKLLMLGLENTNNVDIPEMVEIAGLLLTKNPKITLKMQKQVIEIGERFEFYRDRFNPEMLPDTDKALQKLYQLFEVEPVKPRHQHDGKTAIILPDGDWESQYDFLWDYLVPPSHHAKTVQGEVIRIAGRINDEIFRNGGGNWDKHYRAMMTAYQKFVASQNALITDELAKIKAIAKVLPNDDENLYRLQELAVKWVSQNPDPITLEKPNYQR